MAMCVGINGLVCKEAGSFGLCSRRHMGGLKHEFRVIVCAGKCRKTGYNLKAVVKMSDRNTEWKKKQRWDLLDLNSVCLSIWGRGDGLFCGVRWQVSLTWLLPWHGGLIPCSGLASEKFNWASVSTPSTLKPRECYKIITTTNQFTNKRQTNNCHWQTNMSQSLSLHRKTIKGVPTILRRTQTDQADFEIAFDLLRQHQKHACIPGHLKPSSWKQNKGLIQAITFRKCLFLPTCTLTLIHGNSCFESFLSQLIKDRLE